VTPESFADFVELIVPELQRRGVYKREYRPGTLREKLYGPGRARLPQSHPSAAYRYNSTTKTASTGSQGWPSLGAETIGK
jgi:long-chain alkane monooxygenase